MKRTTITAAVMLALAITASQAAPPITVDRKRIPAETSAPAPPKLRPLTSQRFTVHVVDGDIEGDVVITIDAHGLADWAKRALRNKTGRATLAGGAVVSTLSGKADKTAAAPSTHAPKK